ncbi:MAG: LysM peptidoglycan-binding domain-containing protein [bacterium]|nr:LysM peptidoglycan-binding domain-containing protein [bacterium]
MKSRILRTVAAALLLPACASPGRLAAQTDALRARQAAIIEEISALKGEVRALQAAREAHERRFSDESDGAGRAVSRIGDIERRLAAIERDLAGLRTETERRMQAVIEAVKSENAQLRAAIEKSQKTAVASGWEHTVAAGETLAAIAKKYEARLGDIVEANDLKDADLIRPGQKLFIPRRGR